MASSIALAERTFTLSFRLPTDQEDLKLGTIHRNFIAHLFENANRFHAFYPRPSQTVRRTSPYQTSKNFQNQTETIVDFSAGIFRSSKTATSPAFA